MYTSHIFYCFTCDSFAEWWSGLSQQHTHTELCRNVRSCLQIRNTSQQGQPEGHSGAPAQPTHSAGNRLPPVCSHQIRQSDPLKSSIHCIHGTHCTVCNVHNVHCLKVNTTCTCSVPSVHLSIAGLEHVLLLLLRYQCCGVRLSQGEDSYHGSGQLRQWEVPHYSRHWYADM